MRQIQKEERRELFNLIGFNAVISCTSLVFSGTGSQKANDGQNQYSGKYSFHGINL
jgi:hypothetical protein